MTMPVHVPSYEIIEHPADVGFEVHAPDRPRLFAHAVLAMFDMIVGLDRIGGELEVELDIEGSDDEDLLVALLSRCLVILEAQRILLCEVEVDGLVGHHLRLRARGETVDPERHPFQMGVKAITYHQLFVGPDADGSWRARVILDI